MAVTKRPYWVPIRLTTLGFARVEAFCPEDAVSQVEDGDFAVEEGLAAETENVEVIGGPLLEIEN